MNLAEQKKVFRKRVLEQLDMLKALETKLGLKRQHLEAKQIKLDQREKIVREEEELFSEAREKLREEQVRFNKLK